MKNKFISVLILAVSLQALAKTQESHLRSSEKTDLLFKAIQDFKEDGMPKDVARSQLRRAITEIQKEESMDLPPVKQLGDAQLDQEVSRIEVAQYSGGVCPAGHTGTVTITKGSYVKVITITPGQNMPSKGEILSTACQGYTIKSVISPTPGGK